MSDFVMTRLTPDGTILELELDPVSVRLDGREAEIISHDRCLVAGCACNGFDAVPRPSTRCSGCGRRVHRGGPHGRPNAVDCMRKGLGPDRVESYVFDDEPRP